MNIYKKIISTICASVFAFSCFWFNASAKVIEPEIVKTESWTTSYFIDDDMDTLYPYIQCEADIYNDGTVKCYYWNTREWDGFDTVQHNIGLPFIGNFQENSEQCNIAISLLGDKIYDNYTYIGLQYMSDFDIRNKLFSYAYSGAEQKPETYYENKLSKDSINTYPSYYVASYGLFDSVLNDKGWISSNAEHNKTHYFLVGWNGKTTYYNSILSTPCITTSLAKFSTNTKYVSFFSPNNEITKTSTIHFLGHDIVVTPDLLTGNVLVEPELTEQEKYIKQLEEENSKLKAEIESYKKLDFNGDGLLTNADAQMILIYYTGSLVGKTTGKVEDYFDYVKQISG